ncbi:MAG: class B sortase [Lachnospiraceae bacterium]|nr:class B sortase [Lachnospiraceae bacterium]
MIRYLVRLLMRLEELSLLLLCLLMLLGGGYGLYDSYLVYRQANDDSILKLRPDRQQELPEKELQGRVTGWLTLEGTGIDYPVMQGKDNFEYLNKNPYGEYALSGSVFLDAGNSPDYADEYSLLYGHHMEQGLMFGDLDRYREEEFFRQHHTGTLLVEGEERNITLMAVLDVLATEERIFSPASTTKEAVCEIIQENAIHCLTEEWDVEGKQLIAFSTCRKTDSIERTVVIGLFD